MGERSELRGHRQRSPNSAGTDTGRECPVLGQIEAREHIQVLMISDENGLTARIKRERRTDRCHLNAELIREALTAAVRQRPRVQLPDFSRCRPYHPAEYAACRASGARGSMVVSTASGLCSTVPFIYR